ncbi:MAG: hypothetical protein LC797_23755 [Chloroflexi bacterium]|nr:hypothetical protein [Chloroflexota bacterium]
MSGRKRIGVVGVSGYGGGEILRLCAQHPAVEVVYAAGESSAGQRLGSRYPGPGIVVDAKTGISGAGRGGGSTFGFAEVNEDVAAYSLFKHPHTPEIREAISRMADGAAASIVFSPHLVPMTRGILATCYAHGTLSTQDALRAAREFYAEAAFVRVSETPPHSKWSQGTNLAFVSYAGDPETQTVIALGALDNLGKGAAGQAVQNMNLMLGCPEQLGLELVPMLP